jgi:hypothetical protein
VVAAAAVASAAALAAAARPALPWRALERSAEDGGLRCLLQGWGVFAGQDIPGEVIYTAYIGEIVSKEEADRREHGNGYDGQVSWMAGGGGGYTPASLRSPPSAARLPRHVGWQGAQPSPGLIGGCPAAASHLLVHPTGSALSVDT